MAGSSIPSIALVLPGEAMWGAFQTGFALELGERLQAAGYGGQPFSLTVGSSSGSLVAIVAAALRRAVEASSRIPFLSNLFPIRPNG